MTQSTSTVLNYRRGMGIWTPPPTLVAHGRFPIAADAEFFREPPVEIGALVSAETTLRQGKNPLPVILRILFALLAGIPGFALMMLGITGNLAGPLVMGLVIAGIGIAIVLVKTRFKHTCTYVGEAGASRYVIQGSREAVPREDGILFQNAYELRTAQTRHYYNGIYNGTSYSFRWTDPQGNPLFSLKGKYYSKKGTPKQGNLYYFAQAAEIAWSIHYLDRAQAELKQYGFVHFNVRSNEWVRVGPGFLEFFFKGETARIDKADIKSVKLGGGQFNIVHRDAGWFSRKGKFTFRYGVMANARVFLLALDKLLGYRFT